MTGTSAIPGGRREIIEIRWRIRQSLLILSTDFIDDRQRHVRVPGQAPISSNGSKRMRETFYRRVPGYWPVFVLLVLSLNVLSFDTMAQKVYKWVDEDGKTHYGDKAPSGRSQEIHVPKTPAVDPSVNTRKERTERLLDAYRQERTEKQAMRDAATKETEKRQVNCEKARASQYKYEHSSFLYTTDEDGNRVILGDEEYAKAIANARDDVDRWCGEPQ
jgi:Domain of unknown function (DUF4124)